MNESCYTCVYMWHDLIICVRYVCDTTCLSVWRDLSICVKRFLHTFDMTHSYVRHDPFICVTWRIHAFDWLIHPHVWHDSFIQNWRNARKESTFIDPICAASAVSVSHELNESSASHELNKFTESLHVTNSTGNLNIINWRNHLHVTSCLRGESLSRTQRIHWVRSMSRTQ